jgi:GTPase-activator protein for Ras-like GTPase
MVGSAYLKLTLGAPIQEICDKQLSLEVDPRKLKSTRDRAANMKRLLLSCQNFLDWILTSTSNAPFTFRLISNKLFTEVGAKFPQSKYSSVGGFLFLRFFCPAIISPEGHNVIPDAPNAIARRSLVLIAKAQQNLANGYVRVWWRCLWCGAARGRSLLCGESWLRVTLRSLLILRCWVSCHCVNICRVSISSPLLYLLLLHSVTFGGKEEYMVEVNSFIEKNTEAIQMYFDSMVRLPKTLPYVPPMEIDLDAVTNSLNTVHDFLEQHQAEVDVVLAGGRVADAGTDTFRTERGNATATHDATLSDFTLTSALDLTDDDLDRALDEDAAALNWAGEDSDEEGVRGHADQDAFLEEAESGDDVVFGGASDGDQFYDDDTYQYDDDDQYQEVSEVYTDMELDETSDSDGEWGDGDEWEGVRPASVAVDPREGLKSVLAILRRE